jgi:signal transduction histidine kinase
VRRDVEHWVADVGGGRSSFRSRSRRCGSADGRVMVGVADRGPGVPAADRRLIFEKFGPASGGGAKPGTGLGLYIARSIAEAHGESLEVETGPARGAVFTLSLPVG